MKYPFLLLVLATALAVGAPVDSDDTGSLNEIVSLAQDRLHDWWMASLGREVWDWAKKAESTTTTTTTTTTSATTTTKAVTITGGAMTDAAETTTMTMTTTVVRTVYYGMNSVDGASGRDTITSLAPAPAPSTSTSSSTRATSERNNSTDDDNDNDDERQAKIHPRTHGMGGLMSKISEDCVSTDTGSGSTPDADSGVETTVDTTTTTITVVGTIYNMSPGGDSTGDASSASGATTTGLASASIPVFSPLSFLKPSTMSSPLSSASSTTTTSSAPTSTYTYIPPPTPPELLHAATLTPGRLLCTPHSLSVPLTSLHLAADTFASTCNASSSPPHLSTRGCQVIADSGDAVVSMCGLSNTVMACGDLAEAVRALESPDACVADGKVGGHVEFAWGMLVVCSRSAVVVE